ncbi:ADP-ribosylglycohydrolase family protein [Serpentinicella alkaliphila]|uniref:ADP-ribosylglycohydrolase n=1 Tax=Serpentinicella alkaliphila TaxID=1734049 RepID=A0A4R2U4I4_9FIRM|nr:ADP-ribosylglycohydrolase family protein [Serpentinicella alkaliphila]TCQ02593.1 ADP-ribosylglycohydrolase [Serpentinicella alkaliphila]
MDRLYYKVYGSLIGAAIGDAMGRPVETYHYEEISKEYGWIDNLLHASEGVNHL